ncbi:MAG TPA: GNAT family N-acetyltransferase [Solirubrobacteraceae bacterium]
MRFVSSPADRPPASGLVAAMIDELVPLYGRIDIPQAPSATPAEMGPPGGAFLVGWEDELAVCCGGLKRLSDEACEIKRMFVVPQARGRGIAQLLLDALEDAAGGLGYSVARLDTGAKQPHAQRLYERAGYRSVADFNANPFASFWGEKQLAGSVGDS